MADLASPEHKCDYYQPPRHASFKNSPGLIRSKFQSYTLPNLDVPGKSKQIELIMRMR
jgi:hypothetical protein